MSETPVRRPWPVRAYLLLAVVLTVTAFAAYHYFRPTPPAPPPLAHRPYDPPLDPWTLHPSPFRNTGLGVKYLGDAACAACHPAIDRSYHQHPMGRSASLNLADGVEKPNAMTVLPVAVGPYRLTPAGGAHRLTSLDCPTLPAYEPTVSLAIGSGQRGRSYVTTDRGAAWQSPLSWYTERAQWDVSPGIRLDGGGRRAVQAECLFCHVNRTDPEPRAVNRFKEVVVGHASLGCERCHGPGELHAAERSGGIAAGKPDDSIVNPKHLPHRLQTDVCRQCHLLGEQRVARRGRTLFEYRPGLPLEQFVSVFVAAADGPAPGKSVGQFEQMERSKCHAGGAMTCTSCHDPHAAPAADRKAEFYRAKCQTCHERNGCTEREPIRAAVANDCVRCHMPKAESTSIAHAAVTNHAIPRRPPADKPGGDQVLVAALKAYYAPGPYSPPAAERDRDHGIAMAALLGKLPPRGAAASSAATAALAKLQPAVARWPDDEPAWLAVAGIHGMRDEHKQRATAAREAVRAAPHSEHAWSAAMAAEYAADEYAAAVAAADRLIAMNPSATEYRFGRASALIGLKRWADAEKSCRDGLAIHPLLAEGRILLAAALRGQNKHTQARAEAEAGFALATDPATQDALRKWLERQR